MATEPRQTRRAVAGGLIIAILLGAAVLTFFMEDVLESRRQRYTVIAVMPDAPGLAAGSPVWIGGKEVGSVVRVEFQAPNGDTLARIAVTMQLPVRHQPQVRADSRVRVTSERVISEPVVNIIPGTAAAPMLVEGDTLRKETRLGTAELTARAAVVRSELNSALAELRTLTPPVRARLAQTQRAFASLDLAMAEARQIQRDVQANAGMAALRDPAFAATLERTRAHAAELPRAIGTLQERVTPDSEVGAALTRLQARAGELSAQLAAVSGALADPNSSLARFQQDTALVRALNAARTELDSLIADVRRRPLRYVF